MSIERVEAVLRSRIGLDPSSIGHAALEMAVRARVSASGSMNIAEYADRLERNSAEIDLLIEEIVVSETWFFREQPAFELLREHCVGGAPERDHPYRVLSIPCATGEEPYSIAIRLLSAGVPAGAFEIHAADVSARALEVARAGVYGKNSFRGAPPELDSYFENTSGGRRVLERVRECVRFANGNVLDPWLHAGRQFDAVFCRNLLIYLDPNARQAALRNLTRVMQPEALLFVGHSEALEVMGFGLRRAGDPGSFAFAQPAPARARKPSGSRPRAATPAQDAPAAKPRAASPRSAPRAQTSGPRTLEARLRDARLLADRGQLATARQQCEQVIAVAPSADGYCLLGIIKTASGDHAGALEAFNKALYLDAAHYDALVHQALLHEKAGDRAAADKLRGRAERAAQRAARKEEA